MEGRTALWWRDIVPARTCLAASVDPSRPPYRQSRIVHRHAGGRATRGPSGGRAALRKAEHSSHPPVADRPAMAPVDLYPGGNPEAGQTHRLTTGAAARRRLMRAAMAGSARGRPVTLPVQDFTGAASWVRCGTYRCIHHAGTAPSRAARASGVHLAVRHATQQGPRVEDPSLHVPTVRARGRGSPWPAPYRPTDRADRRADRLYPLLPASQRSCVRAPRAGAA